LPERPPESLPRQKADVSIERKLGGTDHPERIHRDTRPSPYQLHENPIQQTMENTMKPMLAHIFEQSRWVNEPTWVQPKLNGVRALYQNGFFQSRDEIPWNEPILRHLSQPLKLMFPDERTILDGELYVHGWPLQKINGAIAINRLEPNEETFQVEYHIFDVVSYKLPFEERFYNTMRLKHLFTPDIKVRLVETIRADTQGIADDFYAAQVSKGYEGIMYRIGECPYTHPKEPATIAYLNGDHKYRKHLSDKNNRVWHMLKRKDWKDDEFECVGTIDGEGKYKGLIGSLMCSTGTGKFFCAGSGLTDKDREDYTENPPIGRKVKIKFLTYTSDGKPFNPTILAVL
jgi:DNA ligase